MKRAVLVTGGAGYVGSHTCKALAKAGYLPVAYDNLSTGHESFVRWGPLVKGDIHDATAVSATLRQYGVIATMHFAANAYVRESIVDPAKYYMNNVAGTLSLLAGMRGAECNHIVFSSTCAVYGEPALTPIAESTVLAPVNPYGFSKLIVERILADFQAAYDLRSICLRYFNACGADEAAEIGELRNPETHLIARAMMTLQGYIDDFQLFGTDFNTLDGTAVRDYIHVADLADAHCAALDVLLRGGATSIFNLGTGVGTSVKQVLDAIQVVTGRALPAIVGRRQPGDPAELVADATVARRVLGFTPGRSDLQRIIETAWAWHLKAHPRRTDSEKARFLECAPGGGQIEQFSRYNSQL